jgi:hypothetical protein
MIMYLSNKHSLKKHIYLRTCLRTLEIKKKDVYWKINKYKEKTCY